MQGGITMDTNSVRQSVENAELIVARELSLTSQHSAENRQLLRDIHKELVTAMLALDE